MSELRILHFTSMRSMGGISSTIMEYYRNIDRENVQFDFLLACEEKSPYEDEILRMGGKIFRCAPMKISTFFRYIVTVDRFFQKHSEYKIVHAHASSLNFFLLLLAKKNGLPIRIAHAHNAKNNTPDRNVFKELIRDFLRLPTRYFATHLFACSKACALWNYGNKAVHKKECLILNNAIDSDKFRYDANVRKEVRAKLNIDDKFVIGNVAAFVHAKNHRFIIDVFKLVHDKNDRAILMLVGDGALRQKIEKLVSSLGLTDSVIFMGSCSNIPQLLQAMDVFLFPSYFEGLGIAVVEAQASGLPCVISDTLPNEAKIINYIEISLNAPLDVVTEKILMYAEGYKRLDMCGYIKRADYDIKSNAKKLSDFYITCQKNLQRG